MDVREYRAKRNEERPRRDLGFGLDVFRLARRLRSDPPVDEVAGVESDAEQIGGDEAELSSADADDADDGAVDSCDDPALPEFLANEHGGENCQNARKIVEANHVEHL